jgi:hypothetical protein
MPMLMNYIKSFGNNYYSGERFSLKVAEGQQKRRKSEAEPNQRSYVDTLTHFLIDT